MIFLNGELDEEIYVQQSGGFVSPSQEKKVCKLIRSLNWLKQAPKQWHEKFDSVMWPINLKSMNVTNVYMSKAIRIVMALYACMLMIR